MSVIKSILDNDAYKHTMQQAVLELYPKAQAEYEFTSRKSVSVNQTFLKRLMEEINLMRGLRLQVNEKEWIEEQPHFKPSYVEYLNNYRFDPNELEIFAPKDEVFDLQQLKIRPRGYWHKTILWEVPILALISECFYETVDTKWNYDGQKELILNKAKILDDAGCVFTDFGTRRRRSYRSQECVVNSIVNFKNCLGTSNMYLAMLNNTRAIGTVAHEFTMGISGLESLRHANRYALYAWNKVYQGELGIALPDTFGTKAFFEDFDGQLARIYDGVRHDSDDPFKFAKNVVSHYYNLKIDSNKKLIVFSDDLNALKCVDLKKHCGEIGINCSFGIGTNFTNSYENSPALNIVMKLRKIASEKGKEFIQVVKLSDVPSKATGDRDALRVANWTFNNQPLDQ